MMKNKKGAELSMNLVIIGVILIIVLLVAATFFLGGTSNVWQRVKDVFGGAAGNDRAYVEQTCQQYCITAQSSVNPQNSAYCTKGFDIIDVEGEDLKCWGNEINVPCSGVSCPGDENIPDEAYKGI